jgi:hypothetical protein
MVKDTSPRRLDSANPGLDHYESVIEPHLDRHKQEKAAVELVGKVLHGRNATVFEGLVLNPLLGKPAKTVQELAKQFGVPADRIHKIKHDCIERLKKEVRNRKLPSPVREPGAEDRARAHRMRQAEREREERERQVAERFDRLSTPVRNHPATEQLRADAAAVDGSGDYCRVEAWRREFEDRVHRAFGRNSHANDPDFRSDEAEAIAEWVTFWALPKCQKCSDRSPCALGHPEEVGPPPPFWGLSTWWTLQRPRRRKK